MSRVPLDQLEYQVSSVHSEILASQDRKVPLVFEVSKDNVVHKAHQDLEECPDLQVCKVPLAFRAQLVFPDFLALLVFLDLPAILVLVVLLAIQVSSGKPVTLEIPE